jgi:uncharacterized membrane protein
MLMKEAQVFRQTQSMGCVVLGMDQTIPPTAAFFVARFVFEIIIFFGLDFLLFIFLCSIRMRCLDVSAQFLKSRSGKEPRWL